MTLRLQVIEIEALQGLRVLSWVCFGGGFPIGGGQIALADCYEKVAASVEKNHPIGNPGVSTNWGGTESSS